MVLKTTLRSFPLLVLLGLAPTFPASADVAKPSSGETEVVLPLADYLALVSRAEELAKTRAAREKAREAPVAEVIEERISLRLSEDSVATVESFFEVLIQGDPVKPVWLPLPGFGEKAKLERLEANGSWVPATTASLTAFVGKEGGGIFVSPERGHFRIVAKSRLAPNTSAGRTRFDLLRVAAPVASAEVDLPADLEWSSPGAVIVQEEVRNDRRFVRLATQRGTVPSLQVSRRFDRGEEKPLAHVVALTLFQLLPEGLRRHDVLLYEVSRGQLSSFEVALPAGLELEQVATDEGPALPLTDGGRLRIDRQRQLQGTGYLVLSSTPAGGEELPFAVLKPEVEVRARYLAVTSTVAARIAPSPAAGFSQIDLDDLPQLLGQALGAIRLAAAWRLQEAAGPRSLTLAPLPPVLSLATVKRRDTTTLLTVDGTLLHRESFVLAPTDRPANAFEITLPEGASLWSTKIDDQPVRPLQRGGKLVLPIFSRPGASTRIEVVSVLEKAIARGRSQLEIELAQIEAPVLEQSWRLLLPDGPKYRYAEGDLLPVPATAVDEDAGVAAMAYNLPPPPAEPILTDRITVGGAENLAMKKEAALANEYNRQVGALQQGLVGGVKPLPITIPENGKALFLSGVLPPQRIRVSLDVKAK